MRLPSEDQLGKPALGDPSVRSLAPVPSARTIMIFAGLLSRALKNPPNPNTSHCPSGDQLGEYAAPVLSRNTRCLFEPSASMIEIDDTGLPSFESKSVTANFPSREK